MYNITFQQIKAFLTVADYLNMSRAAESLYISQPTLSKILQRFESGIGFRVFTRSNQGVALTAQGEYLFGALESMYNSIEKVIDTAKDLSPEPKRTLRVVVPSSYDAVEEYDLLKQYVQKYEKKFPDIMLLVQLCDFPELRRKLEFGEVDIAFSHDFAVSDIPGVQYREICEYPLYLAISERHPLARYDSLQMEKLSETTLFAVPYSRKPAATELILRRCEECGFTPKRIEFLDNFPTLLHMLREGRGVGMCARFVDLTSGDPGGIKYYPLKLVGTRANVVVAWYDDRLSPEAKAFINMLPKE